MSTIIGSAGTVWTVLPSSVGYAHYVNFTNFSPPTLSPPPYDVVCPRCKAGAGVMCSNAAKFDQRWKKGRGKKREWFSARTETKLPHIERVQESKIQEVQNRLDRLITR